MPMPRWLWPSAVVAVLTPLAVAVLAQRDAHWHPVYDLAMTELRVRDVGGAHTPLIGLQGRIGPSGSHPGPLSFYLLAPVYRLLGSSAFALQAATAVFHGAGAVTALWVARRRGGRLLVVAVSVVLLLLMQGYGLGALTEPWNPHLPMLWFVAFLLAAWAVLDGDLPMLVVAVVAASICAQTHVPYLAVTLGVAAAVTAAAAWHAWRPRRDRRAGDWRWLAAGAAVGLVLWIPPLVDEVVNEPGNLTQLADHLGTPSEDPIGVREATKLVVERLDAWQLVVVETVHPGTYVRVLSGPGPAVERGALTLGVWAVSVLVATVLRHRRLLVLHGLVAVAVAVAVAAVSRIYGVPWHYLMLWGFGIGGLMLLAIVATVVVALGRRWPALQSPGSPEVVILGASVLAALSLRVVLGAADATTETPAQTAQLGRLVPDTVEALEDLGGPDARSTNRYYLWWDDATHGGSEGIGLVNELIRRGFDVGVDERDGVKIGTHRVRDPADATARIVVASGGWIERWSAAPGARRVAYDDPRTPAERAEFAQVRQRALDLLSSIGREDLAPRIDTDLFDLALNERVDPALNPLLGRMLDLGVPVAVFVLPGEVQ